MKIQQVSPMVKPDRLMIVYRLCLIRLREAVLRWLVIICSLKKKSQHFMVSDRDLLAGLGSWVFLSACYRLFSGWGKLRVTFEAAKRQQALWVTGAGRGSQLLCWPPLHCFSRRSKRVCESDFLVAVRTFKLSFVLEPKGIVESNGGYIVQVSLRQKGCCPMSFGMSNAGPT